MKIADCFGGLRPVFSFEFFPPKTEEGQNKLFATIEHLAELHPSYVSITYGAGGSTRDLTLDIAGRIKRETGIEPMAHLTCVGHTQDDLKQILDRLTEQGVENVLALRGDPPKGQDQFVKTEGGFGYANELMDFIRGQYPLCVGGACYPEGHPESHDLNSDVRHLVAKVDAGASFLVTQLFFDNALYFDFVRRVRAVGVSVPIVPGIMPVTNVSQLERFTQMCGASIPVKLRERLNKVRDDEQAVMAVGIEWALRQCQELLTAGAPGIHFYTLNRSLATRVIYMGLQSYAFRLHDAVTATH
jgi:methylenetetrahydrofolate reductase (NADPH)